MPCTTHGILLPKINQERGYATMYRGTTPTLKIKVNGKNGKTPPDIQTFKSIYVTIKQGETELTKTDNDIRKEEENVLSVALSQEETLMFGKGHVDIQLRAVTDNGVAIASNIKMAFMEQILKDGVVE